METGHLYKASLDKQAKWGLKWGTYPLLFILSSTCIVFLIVNVCVGIAYALFLFTAVLAYYLTRSVRGYILYDDKLDIKKILLGYDNKIILSDIEKAESFSQDDFFSSRRLSNFSIFGYYGNFHHSTIGNYKMYATNLNNLIMITLKDSKHIVISPDDMGLLDALNKRS